MTRWRKSPMVNHQLRADDCRQHPGTWIEIGPYNSRMSAMGMAYSIRTAYMPQYTPVGRFETRVRLTDTGATLYARYLGPAT